VAHSPTTSSAALRVLIVEDDPANSEVLTLLLEMGGHTVFAAATAHEALERAAADRPDVVLLDLGLPDMDGREISTSLRATSSPSPRIIITSGADVGAAEASALGADAVLGKPFDPERLLALLERQKA
jgi:two-component system KDP operon response regulator KdpE